LFGSEELEKARKEWNRRLEQCPAEQRPWLVLQYANPVLNQYRIKQQS
ncbi:MAG: glycerol acyltransferase, partial [Pseudomonas aeruginosa]|nr:glycerol acyltransferase [Pseudomonas aeruginosa]